MTQYTYVGDGNSGDGIVVQANSTGKLAFYGKAPVVQAAKPTAVTTTASTSTSPTGYSTTTQADAIVTAVNAIITALSNVGITV